MSTATLTSESKTTIPKDIRRRLNLHPGDCLEYVIDEDSRVLMLPARPVSVEDMNRAIRNRGDRR
jgi:AbrB family looped-hinge helix DNA binding protein